MSRAQITFIAILQLMSTVLSFAGPTKAVDSYCGQRCYYQQANVVISAYALQIIEKYEQLKKLNREKSYQSVIAAIGEPLCQGIRKTPVQSYADQCLQRYARIQERTLSQLRKAMGDQNEAIKLLEEKNPFALTLPKDVAYRAVVPTMPKVEQVVEQIAAAPNVNDGNLSYRYVAWLNAYKKPPSRDEFRIFKNETIGGTPVVLPTDKIDEKKYAQALKDYNTYAMKDAAALDPKLILEPLKNQQLKVASAPEHYAAVDLEAYKKVRGNILATTAGLFIQDGSIDKPKASAKQGQQGAKANRTLASDSKKSSAEQDLDLVTYYMEHDIDTSKTSKNPVPTHSVYLAPENFTLYRN